jgi:(2Fe-2S) ferredoxin
MPSRKRIVVCRGQYCNLHRDADRIVKVLEPLVESLNGDSYPKPIKLETANCLSMCGSGPNLVIYPEGVEFHFVTPGQVSALVLPHLENADDVR